MVLEKFILLGLDSMPAIKSIRYASTQEGSHFVCTGNPGTGFYPREADCQGGLTPVPLCFAGNVRRISDGNAGAASEGGESRVPPAQLPTFVLMLIAGLSVFCLLLQILPLKSENDWIFIILPLISMVAFWKLRKRYYMTRPYSLVPPPVREVNFHWQVTLPSRENIDEYYISTASNAISNMEDGLQKKILENFVACLSDASLSSHFDADSKISQARASLYKKLCKQFEALMTSCEVFSLDYFQHVSDDEASPDAVSLGKASLYVGAFDFICSSYDTPVIDFGSFQLYLYPKFMIKAYDPFTFDVYDYPTANVFMGIAKVEDKDFQADEASSNKKSRLWQFRYLSIEAGGKPYSILLKSPAEKVLKLEKILRQFFSSKT